MKVVKFGGTSMSTAATIQTVGKIISSDPDRRFAVVSAPGKSADGEIKVTDMLISVAEKPADERTKAFAPVFDRFMLLSRELGLDDCLKDDLARISNELSAASRDYIVSRGEYLSAKLLAKYIGYAFIDAAQLIKFNKGAFDESYTEHVCTIGLNDVKRAVIPGFYGSDGNGEIVTFSRGGSDVSGAIVARCVKADVYENFTDVDGFMTCDPKLVPHASVIDVISYNELRELSYMGANVLHPESIFPVRKAGIPIHIRNTFNPHSHGTLIVPAEMFLSGEYKRERHSPIAAIAGRKHFYSLYIDKSLMNTEVGFMRKVLSCFEHFDISVEHIPSGIDSLTVVFSAVDQTTANSLIQMINEKVKPDHIHLTTDMSLIAIVGHGMKDRPGTAARAISRLSNANINLRMIDQGASEINIILGVSDADFDRALIALNGEFEV